jgi:1,4-dihydroxy-2-naphtoate prenyltransferase (EC 2.5.1.-)
MPTEIPTNPMTSIKPNPKWKMWWEWTRPHTLTASFVPVTLGTVMALDQGRIHILLFLAMLTASLFIQAATNLFNEYFDYKRGLDNEQSVGIGGAIVRDGAEPALMLKIAWTLIFLSVLLGLYISANSSWWVALIGTLSILIGYLYSGGPYPISYTPFGELLSGLFMGINIVLISYYIQTGTITPTSILLSIPITILIGSLNLANNIRDRDGDKENGRKTLPVLLGRKQAVKLLAALFAISYSWILVSVLFFEQSPWLLLVLLSVPKPLQAIRGYWGKTVPLEMMPAMKATSQTNTFFGLLLAAGYLLSHFL